MKVLLIVFGSIFGLMLLAVIAIAIMLPILGKKFLAQTADPVARARTASKIARFTVPPGYRLASATDLGITQSAMILPNERGHGALVIQLSSQHAQSSSPDSMLDGMTTGYTLTAKFQHCDLKREADDTIAIGDRHVAMRVLGCANGTQMHVEMGVVKATASTVQVIGTSLGGPFDHASFERLVSSIR